MECTAARIARWVLAVALSSTVGLAQGEVHGRVVDKDGQPVAEVRMCRTWSFPDPVGDSSDDPPNPLFDDAHLRLVSDANGEFAGTVGDTNLVLAIEAGAQRGALVPVDAANQPLSVTLQPLTEVRATFEVHAAGVAPKTLALWASSASNPNLIAVCFTTSKEARLLLPPGEYGFSYSTDAINLFSQITSLGTGLTSIGASQPSVDIGTLRLDLPLVVHLDGFIVDEKDQPISGARIGRSVVREGSASIFINEVRSDASGAFRYAINVYDAKRPVSIVASSAASSGIFVGAPESFASPVMIRLTPSVRVHGSFVLNGTSTSPVWTNASLYLEPFDLRVAECRSTNGQFEFEVPPGQYRLHGYGTDTGQVERDLTLAREQFDVDLGEVGLAPSVIASLRGKDAPPWTVTDARGIDKETKLSDLRGKWVLIEFWGYW